MIGESSRTSVTSSSQAVPDDSEDEEKAKSRTSIACLYCRLRRTRCSGDRPTCQACMKDNVPCEWPSGRKRKRTKKEMEVARQVARVGDGSGSLSTAVGRDPDDALAVVTDAFNPSQEWAINTGTWEAPAWNTSEVNAQQRTDQTIDVIQQLLRDVQQSGVDAREHVGESLEPDLYYYRFSGGTAIQPGIHRITLRVQSDNETSPTSTAPQPMPDLSTVSPSRAMLDLFDSSGMPYHHVWAPLFDLFLLHFTQFMPSISRQRMIERIESGTMSRFLANTICALAARHQETTNQIPTRLCVPFIVKAQELATPLAHLPTTETLTGYLFLAWSYHGQGSESGLWQYTGMANRMAVDIGINEVSEIYDSPAHLVRTRLLWWSLFVADLVVAFSTGRPTSISEDIIEIPLPGDADFFPDPARNTPDAAFEAVEPVPFVYLVRLMVICARICNLLNGRRGRVRTLAAAPELLVDKLQELRNSLVTFFDELPESLRWSAGNLKHQHARGHGGHAVVALVYHPQLLRSSSGTETPFASSVAHDLKLCIASSKQVCECINLADLVSEKTYTALPFSIQPMYIAGMSFIHEIRYLRNSENPAPNQQMLISLSTQNLNTVRAGLKRVERVYAGAGTAALMLERRAGSPHSTSLAQTTTSISLPDSGLLRRFALDPSHPQNLAQPTETSMREYMSRLEQSGHDAPWLGELLTGCDGENSFFSGFDLEGLLAAGPELPHGLG